MRAWAADIAAAVAVGGGEAPERDVVTVGTDLRNAYGRMFRSIGIVSAVKRAPRLVPMLCNRWKPGNARVWQQIGPGQWEAESSLRGGGRGSFLSEVIFALDMEEAWADARFTHEVSLVCIADDGYLVGLVQL